VSLQRRAAARTADEASRQIGDQRNSEGRLDDTFPLARIFVPTASAWLRLSVQQKRAGRLHGGSFALGAAV
jgi:hypothetical protein